MSYARAARFCLVVLAILLVSVHIAGAEGREFEIGVNDPESFERFYSFVFARLTDFYAQRQH